MDERTLDNYTIAIPAELNSTTYGPCSNNAHGKVPAYMLPPLQQGGIHLLPVGLMVPLVVGVQGTLVYVWLQGAIAEVQRWQAVHLSL